MYRILVAVFLVLSSLGLSGCGTYDWHQKMTIEVQTPDGVKSGSAVTSVSWWRNHIFKDGAPFKYNYEGEAAVVDLGQGRFLFALLSPENLHSYTASVVLDIVAERDGLNRSIEAIKRTQELTGQVEVPKKHFPTMITFIDVKNPNTAAPVDPDDLSAMFGNGYSLKSVTLEITEERQTDGRVAEVLPWICNKSVMDNPGWKKLPVFTRKILGRLVTDCDP